VCVSGGHLDGLMPRKLVHLIESALSHL
jgi:hypothetical protein